MNKKTIRLYCYGPVTLDPRNSSPWEDVWLEYKVRRKVVKEGPCFICGVDADIRLEEYMIEHHPEFEEDRNENLLPLLEIKKRFETGERFAIFEPHLEGMPNIYINCKEMRRKEIEEAVEWYLRRAGVLKSKPRFRWNKPDIVIIPVSF